MVAVPARARLVPFAAAVAVALSEPVGHQAVAESGLAAAVGLLQLAAGLPVLVAVP